MSIVFAKSKKLNDGMKVWWGGEGVHVRAVVLLCGCVWQRTRVFAV